MRIVESKVEFDIIAVLDDDEYRQFKEVFYKKKPISIPELGQVSFYLMELNRLIFSDLENCFQVKALQAGYSTMSEENILKANRQ